MPACYRHPQRETGVSCSSCGRAICPDCMTATSVGMRCPECARQRTKVKRMGAVTDDPVLTYALIGVNVLIGLALTLGAGTEGGNGIYENGALVAGQSGVTGVADGQWWRLVTSGFIHGTGGGGQGVIVHLLFNMLSLYILGGMLEPAVGRLRFGLIYLVSMLCGSLGALLITPDASTAGASGAVFGLMGAAVVVLRGRGIGLMDSGLGLWIGLNLLITFTNSGSISIGGHIGGLIGGLVCAFVLFDLRDRLRLPAEIGLALAGAIGLFAAAASIAVASSVA